MPLPLSIGSVSSVVGSSLTQRPLRRFVCSVLGFEKHGGHSVSHLGRGQKQPCAISKLDSISQLPNIKFSRAVINYFPQRLGPQQNEIGFLARTKALMNLPSTRGAMASTSIPWLESNSRASSTR